MYFGCEFKGMLVGECSGVLALSAYVFRSAKIGFALFFV